MLNFQRIDQENIEQYLPFLLNEGEDSCENALANRLVWQDLYQTRFALQEGQLLIKIGGETNPTFALPFGDDFEKGMALIREESGNQSPDFWVQDGNRLDLFRAYAGDRYEFLECRDDFDYLYSRKALADLAGKKYHGKRNHIASFSKKYDWVFHPLSECDPATLLACAEEWYSQSDIQTDSRLQAERKGIELMLEQRSLLRLLGGAILIDGKVVAFTLASPLNSQTVDVHIEKALPAYAEAYTVINHEFAKSLTAFEWINREDDMGLEGLRRSKLSYHPEILLKKYICRARDPR